MEQFVVSGDATKRRQKTISEDRLYCAREGESAIQANERRQCDVCRGNT